MSVNYYNVSGTSNLHGLTYDEYNHIMQEQRYSCDLCRKKFIYNEDLLKYIDPTKDNFAPPIDHNHDEENPENEITRGILCKTCNTTEGLKVNKEENLKKELPKIKNEHKKLTINKIFLKTMDKCFEEIIQQGDKHKEKLFFQNKVKLAALKKTKENNHKNINTYIDKKIKIQKRKRYIYKISKYRQNPPTERIGIRKRFIKKNNKKAEKYRKLRTTYKQLNIKDCFKTRLNK